MQECRWVWLVLVVMLGGTIERLYAEDIGCVSTTFRILGANDKIYVSAFDPDVSGVVCHLSQARIGGVKCGCSGGSLPLCYRVSTNRLDHHRSREASERG